MPPGARKKKAAKRKKELERKEKLAFHHHHHQDLINHGNGHHHHHHHEEKEEHVWNSEAGSPTHNSPHDSHQSSPEAEECEEKIVCVMSTEEGNAATSPIVEEGEKQEALPASESIENVDDLVMDSVTHEAAGDDGEKEHKSTTNGPVVAHESKEVVRLRNEVISADSKVEDEDPEDDSSVQEAARQDNESREGATEENSAVEVVRREDEVGATVPEGNDSLEAAMQEDDVREEGALEASSIIDVVRQIDEVVGIIHEESPSLEVVKQNNEARDQVDSAISAVKVREVDEVKLLEQKIVEAFVPLLHDCEQKIVPVPDVGDEAAIDPPSESPEQEKETVPHVSVGIIKQLQVSRETCCGSNRADAVSTTEVVPCVPTITDRAKWWSCCGLFEVVVGSDR